MEISRENICSSNKAADLETWTWDCFFLSRRGCKVRLLELSAGQNSRRGTLNFTGCRGVGWAHKDPAAWSCGYGDGVMHRGKAQLLHLESHGGVPMCCHLTTSQYYLTPGPLQCQWEWACSSPGWRSNSFIFGCSIGFFSHSTAASVNNLKYHHTLTLQTTREKI